MFSALGHRCTRLHAGDPGQRIDYPIFPYVSEPPSTRIGTPVMKAASGDDSHTTVAATSSTFPKRSIDCRRRIRVSDSAFSYSG